MADETAVQRALQRLEAALGGLESAAAEAVEAAQSRARRDRGQAAMAEDRARLAGELDAVKAVASRLESSRRDALQRIDGAIATLRAVLSAGGEPGSAAR
jgi:hypothetical protein